MEAYDIINEDSNKVIKPSTVIGWFNTNVVRLLCSDACPA